MQSDHMILTHFKKSDRLVCFVLPDALPPVSGISTISHVTSDKSNIFLNVLAVPGPNPA